MLKLKNREMNVQETGRVFPCYINLTASVRLMIHYLNHCKGYCKRIAVKFVTHLGVNLSYLPLLGLDNYFDVYVYLKRA